jgi:hypothetical protein
MKQVIQTGARTAFASLGCIVFLGVLIADVLILVPEAAGREPGVTAALAVNCFIYLFIFPPLWPGVLASVDAIRRRRWGWCLGLGGATMAAVAAPVLGCAWISGVIENAQLSGVSDIMVSIQVAAPYLIIVMLALIPPGLALRYLQHAY